MTPHIVVDTTPFERVIGVGDVHGCDAEIRALLAQVGFRKGSDLLVLVCKGPAFVEAVRTAMSLGGLSVRGNHEENLLESLSSPKAHFSKSGKYDFAARLTQAEIDWLENLPYTISLPQIGVVVVHAGIAPGVDLEKQNPRDRMRMRTLGGAASRASSSRGRGRRR